MGQRYELPPFTFIGPSGLSGETGIEGWDLATHRPYMLLISRMDEEEIKSSSPLISAGKTISHHYCGFSPGHGGRDYDYEVHFPGQKCGVYILYRTHYDDYAPRWIASWRADWWASRIARTVQVRE